MQFINTHDAQTNLLQYLDQVFKEHEKIVICADGKPIAQLTEYMPPQPEEPLLPRKRVLGLWKGKVHISEDFDELPEELMRYFE